MSYGYRLNVEDVFLKNADECWERAKKCMILIDDFDPDTGKSIVFLGPKINFDQELDSHQFQCVSDCVFAVIGWAICLESFVNLAINSDNLMDSDTKNKKLRYSTTYEKIKEILVLGSIDLSDKNWLKDIKDLFELRSSLLHYKEVVEYVGFSFAPKFQKDLSNNNLKRYRDAIEQAIKVIGETVEIETSFLEGEFELLYYDA